MDKYATIIRYGLTYLFASLATKYGIDAATQGTLVDLTLSVVLGLATLGPLVYNLLTRPSTAAMKVAVATDSVLEGKTTVQQVATPTGVPDIKVTALPGR